MDTKQKERAEGWGMIIASGAFAGGWGIVVAMGNDPSPGLAVGPFLLGVWKIAVRGSGFRGWRLVRK